MSMTSTSKIRDLSSLQDHIDLPASPEELEQGRNAILRQIAHGEKLEKILLSLCQQAEMYNPQMLALVQLLDDDNHTLHPVATIALPDVYYKAIDGITTGTNVGSCGTAAFTKKQVVVDDINTNQYWVQHKALALNSQLQACWSEPIIGLNDKVHGTFAVYFRQPTVATTKDLEFIEFSANLAAVAFENEATRKTLHNANENLTRSIDDRNVNLELANQELLKVLAEQDQSQIHQINAEKALTTNSLLAGFAHEINTPLGIAVTAISTAENQLERLMGVFNAGKLTRKVLTAKVALIKDSIALNKNNLARTSELLSTFKSMSLKLDGRDSEAFNLAQLWSELPIALASLLKEFKLKIDSENITIPHSRNAFWQVMHQLIENSVIHGFHGRKTGLIYISGALRQQQLVINYQDNGCGIEAELQQQVFEPFYSTKRTRGSIGLGLNIVTNIITNTFHGKIRCLKAPTGTRFEIIIPLSEK